MRWMAISVLGLTMLGCGSEGGGDASPADSFSGFQESDAEPGADGSGPGTDRSSGPGDDGSSAGDAMSPPNDAPGTPVDLGPGADGPAAPVGCAPERPCDEGERCNLETGVCVPQGACIEDAECPGSRSCIDGACPEASPCQTLPDCDEGRICAAGSCAEPCGAVNPCPGRQICDEASGACGAPAEGCVDNADCPGARECQNGACVLGCVADADCPGSRTCDVATGICPEAAVRLGAADCDLGRVCVENACTPACNADEACGAGRVCDLALGACIAAPAACADDGGCPADQICQDALCIAAECAADADCGAGACVSRRCEAGPMRACDAARPCGFGLVCNPRGECVLAGACQADGDCSVGIDHCELETGLCRACVLDAHCAQGLGCVDYSCAARAACARDADCPVGRTCEAGVCAAAACVPDIHDDLIFPVGLQRGLHEDLILCDADADAYDVGVLEGDGLQVVLRYDRLVGRLALNLRDLFDPTDVNGITSDGGDGLEQITRLSKPAPQSFRISITGPLGVSVPYTLEILTPDPAACIPDALEAGNGNNVEALASPLGAGGVDLTICTGDVDWFEVDIAAGIELSVEATGENAALDFELRVIEPDGDVLVEGVTAGESCVCFTPPGMPEQCNCSPDDGTRLVAHVVTVAAGRHLVRLVGRTPNASGALTLRMTQMGGGTPEELACQNPQLLRAGVPLVLQPSALFNVFRVSCGFGMGSDYVSSFRLDAPATVTVASVDRGFLAAIALRSDCADIGSEAACASGANATLAGVQLGAGTWYVVFKGGGGANPELRLTVQ